jgi:glutathione synthase
MSGGLNVLYVIDPMASLLPDHDSTLALMLEAQTRGHQAWVCTVDALGSDRARGFAHAQRAWVTRPTDQDPRHARMEPPAPVFLDGMDVIWMRKDPPVDDAYLYATMLLERIDRQRTLVLNDPVGLRVVHEKLWMLAYPDLCPHTVVSARAEVLVEFVKARGKGVLKPLHLMGGMGVFAFSADDKNLRSAADLLTQGGKIQALAQEYLPAVSNGDKRVILADGVPIGALLRVPRTDEARANMRAGGTAVRATIDEADRNIAARIRPELSRLGVFFVGIDVIGGKLTEVNVTSPTGLQEIDRLDGRTGADTMAAQLWSAAEKKLLGRRGG